jgi:hypothetical protein
MYKSYRSPGIQFPLQRSKRLVNPEAQDFLDRIGKRSVIPEANFNENVGEFDVKPCPLAILPMTVTKGKDEAFYSFKVISDSTKSKITYKNLFQFVLSIMSKAEEGLYNLYFHSCPNYVDVPNYSLFFDVDIEEKNQGNFLSAGEMPLPALYFMMSLIFFLSGLFWVFILRKTK